MKKCELWLPFKLRLRDAKLILLWETRFSIVVMFFALKISNSDSRKGCADRNKLLTFIISDFYDRQRQKQGRPKGKLIEFAPKIRNRTGGIFQARRERNIWTNTFEINSAPLNLKFRTNPTYPFSGARNCNWQNLATVGEKDASYLSKKK